MKDVAYLAGVCMVATSILALVFAVIGGGSAILEKQIVTGATVGGIGCVVAIVLFFFGMKLVRFGESKGDGEFARQFPSLRSRKPSVLSLTRELSSRISI